MATVAPPADPEADPRVRAVFDDIRRTRSSDFVNTLWRWLAFDPALLEEVWRDVKAVMATESALDAKTKERGSAAVSIANACDCCVHSHPAAAGAKGVTAAEQADLMRIVANAVKTTALLDRLTHHRARHWARTNGASMACPRDRQRELALQELRLTTPPARRATRLSRHSFAPAPPPRPSPWSPSRADGAGRSAGPFRQCRTSPRHRA